MVPFARLTPNTIRQGDVGSRRGPMDSELFNGLTIKLSIDFVTMSEQTSCMQY